MRLGSWRHSYLFVDVADRLLALAVHVEDLQECLIYPLVAGESSLRRDAPTVRPTRICESAMRLTVAVRKVHYRRDCWQCRRRSAFALPHCDRPVVVGIRRPAYLDFVDIVDSLIEFHGCLWLHRCLRRHRIDKRQQSLTAARCHACLSLTAVLGRTLETSVPVAAPFRPPLPPPQ